MALAASQYDYYAFPQRLPKVSQSLFGSSYDVSWGCRAVWPALRPSMARWPAGIAPSPPPRAAQCPTGEIPRLITWSAPSLSPICRQNLCLRVHLQNPAQNPADAISRKPLRTHPQSPYRNFQNFKSLTPTSPSSQPTYPPSASSTPTPPTKPTTRAPRPPPRSPPSSRARTTCQ